MKEIITIILVLTGFISNAATYHVAAIGGDYATIAQVNAASFNSGDSVLFNRGESFYGSLTTTSGVIYGAYGTGDKPIITGLTELTSWTNEGGNIYSATLNTGFYLNNVVINDTIRDMGRYPNTGWFLIDSHVTYTSITDNDLTGSWTGAEAVIRKNKWIIDRSDITSGATTTLSLASYGVGDLVAPGNSNAYNAVDGNGYFIQNSLAALDTLHEWFYDDSTNELYVYSSGTPTNVKVSTLQTLLSMANKSNVTFDNINFEGGNSINLSIQSSNTGIVFQNCIIGKGGGYGMYGYVAGITFDNCTFSDLSSKGIASYGNNIIVEDCTFSNIGMSESLIWTGSGGSAILLNGTGDTIRYNTITNTGYNGIGFSAANTVVYNNYIDSFCHIKDDGGGIYFGYLGNTDGSVIHNNIIVNGVGAVDGAEGSTTVVVAIGIYGDNQVDNTEIYNNTISECPRAIFLNGPTTGINMHDNTLYDNGLGLKVTTYASPATTGVTFNDNIIAKTQDIDVIQNTAASTDIDYASIHLALHASYFSTGTYDSTEFVFYSNDTSFLFQDRTTGEGSDLYSFSGWQTFTSTEANSTLTIDTPYLYYNYNKTDSVVTLGQAMIDLDGTQYASSITISPYSSAILLVDGDAEPPPAANVLLRKNTNVNSSGYGDIFY